MAHRGRAPGQGSGYYGAPWPRLWLLWLWPRRAVAKALAMARRGHTPAAMALAPAGPEPRQLLALAGPGLAVI
eukprot:4501206-Pyramimonas_sp.AAC.1